MFPLVSRCSSPSATKARTRISQLQRSFLQFVDEFPTFFASSAADGIAATDAHSLPAPVWSHLVALVERTVRCGFVAYDDEASAEVAASSTAVPSGSDSDGNGNNVDVFLPHYAERAVAVLPRLFGAPAAVAAASTNGTEQSSAAAAADAPPAPVSVLASLPSALVVRTAETCIGTLARLLRCARI